MATNQPPLGSTRDELDTPALVIDLDRLEANIARIAGLCRERGVDWRPHSKGHKSSEIARRQVAAGAIGVTCAKLGEAEVMAAGGIRDLLIANQIVGAQKLARLAQLTRVADPIVTVDHPLQIEATNQAMRAAGTNTRMIVEVDIGMHRCGVAPGEATLELAKLIDAAPGIELAGIMGYEGHLLTLEDPNEKRTRVEQAIGMLTETKDLLLRAGLPCPIVSAGGTGSYASTLACPGVSELQAGGLIFMDAFYRERCQIVGFDFALTLVATVVSRPAPHRAIIDAGRKTHNMEIHPPRVVGHDDIEFVSLSAEHGVLELAPSAEHLEIGDRLTIIPGYGDFSTVLHNEFYAFRGDRLEAIWPLEARGRLR
ncbi:MAG: DSD1 family PLP-dependent enzyme [Pirellulales bacterium]|nr:DSD1 family PLP-dependent enzyme [Pirellulales bacterium]